MVALAANENQAGFDLVKVMLDLTFTSDASVATIAYMAEVVPKVKGNERRSKGKIRSGWVRFGDKDALEAAEALIPTGTGFVAALSTKKVVQDALHELVEQSPRVQLALNMTEPEATIVYTGTPAVTEQTKLAVLDCLREMDTRGLFKGG